MQSLEECVIEFVADFTGFKPELIHLHTTLYGDLGVAGDDGLELIQAYGKRFQVDLAEFQSLRHFGSEGLSILAPLGLLWMVLGLSFRQKRSPEEQSNLQVIRIRDLITFASAGRWMEKAD